MPKIRPLTETDRKNIVLVAEIARGMAYYKKKNEEMAEALGMSNTTWARRKKYPGTFTLEELRKIKNMLPGTEIAI